MAYQVTLRNGPVSVEVQGYRFARDRTVTVPDADEALALRLKGDANFEVVSLKPASAAPAPAAKKAKVPPPPPPDDEEDSEEGSDEESEEEDEEDEETDLDGDEEGGDQSAPLTRKELKGLKKADLIEIATTNSVEVSPDASKNELIDAILEALGEEA